MPENRVDSTDLQAAAVDEVDAAARRRAGLALRSVGHALVGHEASSELITELAESVNGFTARLDGGVIRQRDPTESASSADADYREGEEIESFDDRPFSGQASPWGLDLGIHRHGDEIEAVLVLGSAHEGAPGRSHGGIVAGLFDDVFGFVLGVLRQAAFTGELTIRYERPTPLHRHLACRGRLRERIGRKIWIEGELVDLDDPDQVVVARGVGLFIAVDRSVFAHQTASLPAPPDEG